jgi:hypothetical protein
MPRGCLFDAWFAFCALLGTAFLLLIGWAVYALVMHFTHGGT